MKNTNPTIILTGFLGSGKTTYLNYLMKNSSNTRFAIIENEYGKESIDGDIILSDEDDIVELNNGCLCCTLNDNLYDILNRLYIRRAEYDQLVIEATGMADPRGIAAPFLTNPSVKKQFPLTAIVCLIDAELIEDQLEETVEAIHQITYSDILLLNKTDLVSKEYVKCLTQKLKGLNPLAKIIAGNFGELSSVKSIHNFNKQFDLGSDDSSEEFPISSPYAHHHHHHTDVTTHTFIYNEPFDLPKLKLRLMAFMMFQSKGLYRMKGLIGTKQSDRLHLIQSVGKRFAIDEMKKVNNGKKSKIIVIGKNLQRTGFENMFNQCQ